VAEQCLADHRVIAEQLLNDVGLVEWLPHEALMDAATALSGSGPAYVFYITEWLAKAGVKAGLSRDTAARLSRATVQGTGAVLAEIAEEPERLRQQVTSPGGTTEAGLAVLMADECLQSLLDATLAAAARRSRELGSLQPTSREAGIARTKSEVSSVHGRHTRTKSSSE
jgi:pyrroline-5-carboxylate reductase